MMTVMTERKKFCCTSIYRTKAGLDIVATLTAALACRKWLMKALYASTKKHLVN